MDVLNTGLGVANTGIGIANTACALKEAFKGKKSAKEQPFTQQTQREYQQPCPYQHWHPSQQSYPGLFQPQPQQTVDKRFTKVEREDPVVRLQGIVKLSGLGPELSGGREHLTMQIDGTFKLSSAGPEAPTGRKYPVMPLPAAVKPSSAGSEVSARGSKSVPGTRSATRRNEQVPGASKGVFKR